jgi:hypothetical protein
MEPTRVRWVDQKGFSLDEWVTEALTPVMTRWFAFVTPDQAVAPEAEPGAARSVLLKFQRVRQEGDLVVYQEVS